MQELIDKRLSELIPSRDETIFEAARYSLLSPGKRLRPQLVLATAKSFGADPFAALDPACAIEMIHTYSLIHDDLPCMDDDDLRRGKPTLHKIYGEAIALLAGDYLLTFAFDVIANSTLTESQKIQMIKILSMHSGAPGLIGGQATDIEMEGKEIDEETLLQMHYGKTASLFTACLEFGAIAAGVPPPISLTAMGRELGLAFQFQDDLLDQIVDGNQKTTAISVFGLTNTKERLDLLKASVFKTIKQLPLQTADLFEMVKRII